MNVATRMLVAGGMAAVGLFGAAISAQAVPITPVVLQWTAVALTRGSVPNPADPTDPILGTLTDLDLAIQSNPTEVATATKVVSNQSLGGAEAAAGRVEAAIDPLGFNNSVLRSTSGVLADSAPNPSPGLGFEMFDLSLGGLSATLSSAGLGLGDTATVDLLLNVTGSLIYADPGRTAGAAEVCGDPIDPCQLVPDISAGVSLLLALADVVNDDPSSFVPLFNGSATLQSVLGGGAPALTREGDWADSARDGDFSMAMCDAGFCQVDVNLTLAFADVQSLGFGEEFDVGLLLLTSADALSDPSRSIASNFFDTAGIDVTLTALPSAAVPAPAPLLLLAAGLLGIAAVRRVRPLRLRSVSGQSPTHS